MQSCKLQHTDGNVDFPSFPMEIRDTMRLQLPPNPASCMQNSLVFAVLSPRPRCWRLETLNDEQWLSSVRKKSIYFKFHVVSSFHKLGSSFALSENMYNLLLDTFSMCLLTLGTSPLHLLFEELSKCCSLLFMLQGLILSFQNFLSSGVFLSLSSTLSAVCTVFSTVENKSCHGNLITVLPIQSRLQDNLILRIAPHCNSASAKA